MLPQLRRYARECARQEVSGRWREFAGRDKRPGKRARHPECHWRVEIEQAGARFKREGRETLVEQAQVKNARSLSESRFDISALKLVGKGVIGAEVWIEQRGLGGKGCLGVCYGGQRLVVYFHKVKGVSGGVAVFGQDDSDRIANVTHAINRHWTTFGFMQVGNWHHVEGW